MPSIAAHMAVAKLVDEKLNINDVDFIKGNILPDIISIENSHHKIKGKCFLVPDIEYFRSNLDFNSKLYLGYYVHLLLDKYFLEEFVPKNISNLNVFKDKVMYTEYSLINYQLVSEFGLEIEFLREILSDFSVPVHKDKLAYILQCLESSEIGPTIYLDYFTFSEFLYYISQVISEEVKDYACKLSRVPIRA